MYTKPRFIVTLTLHLASIKKKKYLLIKEYIFIRVEWYAPLYFKCISLAIRALDLTGKKYNYSWINRQYSRRSRVIYRAICARLHFETDCRSNRRCTLQSPPALLERYFSRRNTRMPELPEIKPRSHEPAVRGSGHNVKELAQRPLPLLFIRSPIQSPVWESLRERVNFRRSVTTTGLAPPILENEITITRDFVARYTIPRHPFSPFPSPPPLICLSLSISSVHLPYTLHLSVSRYKILKFLKVR